MGVRSGIVDVRSDIVDVMSSIKWRDVTKSGCDVIYSAMVPYMQWV